MYKLITCDKNVKQEVSVTNVYSEDTEATKQKRLMKGKYVQLFLCLVTIP